MSNKEEPIIVEQVYTASIDTVWNAITDINQMHQWYFSNIPAFKPEVGFETEFNVECEGRNFLHQWKVTEVVPQKKIAYNWQYEGYAGNSYVVFELSEQNGSTGLKLTHQATEKFPEDIPEFKRENGIAGWTYLIQQSLKEYLAKAK